MRKTLQLNLSLALIIMMVTGACGEIGDETPFTGSPLDSRIQQVENGLVEYTDTGPASSDRKYNLLERISNANVPAVSIAVIEDFKIDWAKGYGVRAAGQEDPVDKEMLFHAGSISKMFSAAGALTLVDAGVLDLD